MKLALKIAFVLAVALAVPFLLSSGSAQPEDYIEDFEEIVPDGMKDTVSEEGLISSLGFDAVMQELIAAVRGSGSRVLSFFITLFGFAILLSFASLSADAFDSGLSSSMRAGASAIATFYCFASLSSLVSEASEGLRSLSVFFSSLAPLLSGLTATGGALGTAGVQALNMNISLAIVERVSCELLLPLVSLMFALSLVSFVSEGSAASMLSSVRTVFMFVLGALTTVLLGATSLQSFIGSASDSVLFRTVKYAVSGTVPVVSGAVSGAFSAVSGAVAYGIASVGAGAVLIILSMALSPLVLMLLYRLALGAALGFMNFSGTSSCAAPIQALRTALDMLIAVYTVSTIIYIIQIAIVMKCGVSLFG